MIFSSASFFVFFVVVFIAYSFSKNVSQRSVVLLVGSMFFYASWKPVYLALLIVSLSINFHFYTTLLKKKSATVLTAGIVFNLSVLVFYKYLGLFVETFFLFLTFGYSSQSSASGLFNFALPLGISFFTFQMLSALIDVYRDEWQQRLTFSKWCLYVSFFPQLIAGPIVRAHLLMDQLNNLAEIKLENFRLGCFIFLCGILKKTLLADNIAPIVETLYAQPEQLNCYLAWFATCAFGIQIYFDFSGYSEMAIGLGKIFGINLPRNFLYPYHSRNITDFWRTWHITLSNWLRDYLYIPLGGSRQGQLNTFRNLMVTMFLGGLWHGAGWTFVFWGILHGFYLIVHHSYREIYHKLKINAVPVISEILPFVAMPMTLFSVGFAWVFFRAETFSEAFTICGLMLGMIPTPESVITVRFYLKMIVLLSIIIIMVEPFIVRFFKKAGISWWWKMHFVIRGFFYAGIFLTLLVFGGSTQKFIYFDF